MADASMIFASKPAPQNPRGIKPFQKQEGDAGSDQSKSGFTDLLSAIEDVAQSSDQVVAVPVEVPAAQLPQTALTASALGGDAQQKAPEAYRLTPFKEIRLLIDAETKPLPERRVTVDLASQVQGKPASADLPFLTSQQSPLTPSQIAALGGLEEAQVLPRTMTPQDIAAVKAEIQPVLTGRADSASLPQAPVETSNPVVRQVATNLQYIARGDVERLRFDLHPEELGRVQIQLSKSGTLTRVTVVTETAQAFEMLKAGAHSLQQDLARAGFDADDVRFESREDRGEGRQAEADERREREDRRAEREEAEERREILIRAANRSDRTIFL
ncbi:MAG: flagellar hook-length control protein FliK [Pseudomonadota bacterium]